ncbi:MAG TPA: SAM-dependent methyltransferase [Novosphingobium sp.]
MFRRLIATHGPITLQHYMGEANARYYAARDPLGTTGDFVTAPEISQIFGEMIGLWLADLWQRAGSPRLVHYVELGPGRGTLARDALRTMTRFGLAPAVHLVEGSLALKAVQLQAVPHAQWHDDLASVPRDAPLLVVANEFFDALPVRQLVQTGRGWRERMVGWDGTAFVPLAGDRPMDAAVPEARRKAPEGTLIETCPGAAAVMFELAGRLAAQGGAALAIDYGYAEPQAGSTLQAVRAHARVDPFADPGAADLTALVDFAALAAAAPGRAADIRAGYRRLTARDEMGDLFKVMGLAAPGWPEGAGFETASAVLSK